jgi:hypothetical protein
MNLSRGITGATIGIGGLVLVAGVLFWLFQGVLWLRDGFWTAFTPVLIFGPLGLTGWGGVDQIVHCIWLQPVAGIVACIGAAIIAFGFAAESA